MFNICKKCFKCRKKNSKFIKTNLEQEKIISYVQKEYGLRVYLNIYHLTIFNYILQFFGIGFFHTSLEINDIEYSFKLGIGDESGIFFNRFKDGIEKKWLKEKIYLGNTPYDMNSVNEIFKLYIPFWLGRSYNLFQKNCNNFTKFFARLLLRNNTVINYPDYVNRITIFADYFNIFYNPIKKLYIYNNNAPSISSSLNSEFMSNENRDNNPNENNNENNDNNSGNSSNKTLNKNENQNTNIEINNNIKADKKSNKKEEKKQNENINKEIKKEEENNGG
jgi:hypothetical protein